MEFAMHFLQLRIGHVGVNLGCREVSVAEQLLYAAQVRPITQEIRGKTVPQGVRGGVDDESCLAGILLHGQVDGGGGEAIVFPGRGDMMHLVEISDEEGSEVIEANIQVSLDRLRCFIGDEDKANLLPLSAYGDFPCREIDVFAIQ